MPSAIPNALGNPVTWNGHRYQVFDVYGLYSWEEMKTRASSTQPNLCSSSNNNATAEPPLLLPHLITISSQQENEFVRQLVEDTTMTTAVGGHNQFDMAVLGLEQVYGTPGNDLCDNAISITGTTSSVFGTIHGATVSESSIAQTCLDEQGYNVEHTHPGVWYKVVAAVSGPSRITATTCNPGTNFDTQISVYTGSCGGGGLTCVGGNDEKNDLPHWLCALSSVFSWSATNAGDEFYVLVHGYNDYHGDFEMKITQQPDVVGTAPSNDVCENAISIDAAGSGHYAVISGTTRNAAIDTVTCNTTTTTSTTVGGVWYKVTADFANAVITADTCHTTTEYDTMISVYRGNSCTGLTCVADNDDYTDPSSFTNSFYDLCYHTSGLTWTASAAGEQYYILVHGHESSYGDFALTIRQEDPGVPGNDLCDNAILLSGSSGSVIGTTLQGATVDSAVGSCGTATAAQNPGVWYELLVTTDKSFTISAGTCNSNTNFETQISVFQGSCSSLVCVDGDSRADRCGYQSAVSWSATAGTPYYILVHGRNTSIAGDFVLDILEDNSAAEPYSWITAESLSYTNWDVTAVSGEYCTAMQVSSGKWEYVPCNAFDDHYHGDYYDDDWYNSTVDDDWYGPHEGPYYAVVVEWDCAPTHLDLDVMVDSVSISLSSTTNFAEAITFQYTYTGAKTDAGAGVNFTYDILQVDCDSTFAPAGNTSKALYFTAFDETITGKVIAKLGINLTAIETAAEVWSHPNNDERQASLEFCGRWNIYIDGVWFQFHETAVTATINLKEDGGFELSSIDAAGLDRQDASAESENVNIDFPVDVFFCNDLAELVQAPTIVNQGKPIQLCIQLKTPTTGVYVQGIDFMSYAATHVTTDDPVTLIDAGTLKYGATAEVDCGQKAGICRVKFLAEATMFVNTAGNALSVDGWAVVAFGTDTRRRRRRRQIASSVHFDGRMRMLEYSEDGHQLTPFEFIVNNLEVSRNNGPYGSDNGVILASVLGVIVLVAIAAFVASYVCRRQSATATETTVQGTDKMDPNDTTMQEDLSSSRSTDLAPFDKKSPDASDDNYEVVEV